MTPKNQPDALRGSVELLVLKTLSLAPMHGWGIGQRLEELSEGTLEVNQGSLYPALQRLQYRGLITSTWEITENNRKARYYHLTAAGRRTLARELAEWRQFSTSIEMILRAT